MHRHLGKRYHPAIGIAGIYCETLQCATDSEVILGGLAGKRDINGKIQRRGSRFIKLNKQLLQMLTYPALLQVILQIVFKRLSNLAGHQSLVLIINPKLQKDGKAMPGKVLWIRHNRIKNSGGNLFKVWWQLLEVGGKKQIQQGCYESSMYAEKVREAYSTAVEDAKKRGWKTVPIMTHEAVTKAIPDAAK